MMAPESWKEERAALHRNRVRRDRLWSRLPVPSEVLVILVLGDPVEVVKFVNAASCELKQPVPQHDQAGKFTAWLLPLE